MTLPSPPSPARSEKLTVEHLDVRACASVTDRGFSGFLTSCKKLRSLRVGRNPQLTDASMRPMLEKAAAYGSRKVGGWVWSGWGVGWAVELM
jgi:hypothetical protein